MQQNGEWKNGAGKVHSCNHSLPLKHLERFSPVLQQDGFAVRKNELKESRKIIMLLP